MDTAQRIDKNNLAVCEVLRTDDHIGERPLLMPGATRHLGHDGFMRESARLKATLEMTITFFLSSQGIFSTNPSSLLL